ncbi:MAG TPA: hypothetical protein VN622_15575 [Clostridia bacterium]|nr:hypothetical protein [Clostridia bacterium]
MVLKVKAVAIVLVLASLAVAQEYAAKFPGDPARSNSEAAALGYMRVVVNAQREYKKRHNTYATSLTGLVGQGSFTKRMTDPNRGDYLARFKSSGKDFSLSMTPKAQIDATHRAFIVDERGTIRAEEEKAATAESQAVKR